MSCFGRPFLRLELVLDDRATCCLRFDRDGSVVNDEVVGDVEGVSSSSAAEDAREDGSGDADGEGDVRTASL